MGKWWPNAFRDQTVTKKALSIFMVSLAVWQVARLAEINSHVHPILTKPQTVAQYLCTQHHLQWIRKRGVP
jgi:hypothetical protein